MRGYVLTRYGRPDAMELREVPTPRPGPGEVLIRVRAAGLNPIDYKLRQGTLRAIVKLSLPTVAGSELAGEVEAVGTGVTRFAVGDRVFARVDKSTLGAFADHAVVAETLAARMPDGLGFTDAAGLPLAGLTSLQALRDELRLAKGDRVFISGGAGGVGTLAIQIAVAMGAQVATTASPRGEQLVRSLGATTVIDYRKEKFTDVLGDYDGAFDLTGGQDLVDSFAILKPGATTVSVTTTPEPATARKDLGKGPLFAALFGVLSWKIRREARRHGVTYRFLFMHPSGTDLETLAAMVGKGELAPVTDRVFPFDRIDDAFAYLEQGRAKGKVIVEM
ncbi:NADP-dependent oxidoreductase [Phytomonospora endophytica]|uniref:Alcohol dehydrogenase n=1 Tax=Phytomonospora endophytica TaxID=714109 RepID=A0A841G1P9_9ACTN|nr:NADP-dependent oxidoreductase [Phytomonospora endophytica]MBB6038609.1 alcohol dehydrogenase [Phytomonospora endophytica]GIG69247.1 NADPH:quinone reductase [Phytomonospora endophytica]